MHGRHHGQLALAIEGAGGFIEQQHWGIFEEGPGQVNALFFADTQASKSIAHAGVVTLRQAHDELMGLSGVGRGLNLGASGPVAAKSDVFGDRRGQKQGFLQDPRHLPAEAFPIQALQVEAAPADHPRGGFQESGD